MQGLEVPGGIVPDRENQMRDMIYIGIRGCAVALDRATGEEVWRAELKGSDFVSVALAGRDVLAASRGRLFCLDASSGYVRWQNELKGLGWGLVSIAGADVSAAAETERQRQAAAAAAAGAGASA
jgi:outer membrane protein assembly factor BamB